MTDQASAEQLITLSEFADRCRRTENTVRYWRKTGYGPRGFRLGRRVVYDRAEVEEFIASCRAAEVGA